MEDLVRLPNGLVRRAPGELYGSGPYLGRLYQFLGRRVRFELQAVAPLRDLGVRARARDTLERSCPARYSRLRGSALQASRLCSARKWPAGGPELAPSARRGST
jgi:hypothetical protein